MPYPYADNTGIIPSTVPNPNAIITAAGGLDSAIEDMRTGVLLLQQMRFEFFPVPLVISGSNEITVRGSYHLITTSLAAQPLGTIYGANQGDVILLERAANSGNIRVGEYWLDRAGAQVLVVIKASGFTILSSTGKKMTPAFKAYRATTPQSISTGVATVVQWNATAYNQKGFVYSGGDYTNCFYTSSYDYLPGIGGLTLHNISIQWASAVAAGVLISIFLRVGGGAGTIVAQSNFRANGLPTFTMNCRFLHYSATSVSYDVLVQQNDAGTHQLQWDANKTFWTGTRLALY